MSELLFNYTDLFPAWLLLTSSSFVVVLIEKLRKYSSTLVTILHIFYLSGYFVFWTSVTIKKDWGVVQTGFFTVELIILMLKMHSYLVSNREHAILAKMKDENEPENASKKLRYPKNVTISNFFWYLLYPVLVYELEYPLKKERNWGYILEKVATFFGLCAVLHVLSVEYIEPILAKSTQISVVIVIFDLIVPFFAGHVIIFYLVFDVGCNTLAELTCFADRHFYDDWWNRFLFQFSYQRHHFSTPSLIFFLNFQHQFR